jgi:hypothetical protein
LFHGVPIDGSEHYLFLLITNNFESDYIDPYFDQNVLYFLLSRISSASQFVLEVGELFDWGYWSRSDFEDNAFDRQLSFTTDEEVFIRHKEIPTEEDEQNEFKEVTDRSILNSIKSNLGKAAIAFLNSRGGSIYFGIADSGTVHGFRANRGRRDEIAKLVVSILNSLSPRVSPLYYNMSFVPIIENGQISSEVTCLRISFRENGSSTTKSASGRSWFRQYGSSVELKDLEKENDA